MVHPRTRQIRRYHQQKRCVTTAIWDSWNRVASEPTATASTTKTPWCDCNASFYFGNSDSDCRPSPKSSPANAIRAAALRTHLELLEQERTRISRQIESVNRTLNKTKNGESLMPEDVFDGFDHTRYKDEVIERWGKDAYTSGDNWWRSMSEQDRKAHLQSQADIAAAFRKSTDSGAVRGKRRRPDDYPKTVRVDKDRLAGKDSQRRRLHRTRPDVRRRSPLHCKLRQVRRRHRFAGPWTR